MSETQMAAGRRETVRKKELFRTTDGRNVLRIVPRTRRKNALRSLDEDIAPIDRRSRLAKDTDTFRRQLIEHVGGAPSPVQAALIRLATQIQIRVAIMDAKFAMEGGDVNACDAHHYLAWVNTLSKTLAKLGLKSAPLPRRSLSDLLAEHDTREPSRSAQDGNGLSARVNGAGTAPDAAERAPRGAALGNAGAIVPRGPGRLRKAERAGI
jgi:hypothetical protein